MARPRQPVEVIMARGKKHLTQAEIEERKRTELKPIADEIIAPDYLTKKQTEEFYNITGKLEKLGIMGETDVDAVARYIVSNDQYINAVKQMRKPGIKKDPLALEQWSKIQERYFKQCRQCANDLGLTISSRCKLVVPDYEPPPPPVENKFAKFEKGSNGA